MTQFGLIRIRFLVLFMFFACSNNKLSNESQQIGYVLYFRGGNDTLNLGEREDVALKVINSDFDSLSLLLGKLEGEKLLDTVGVVPFYDTTAYFSIVPKDYGEESIEGIIQLINVDDEKLVVGSMPITVSYQVR